MLSQHIKADMAEITLRLAPEVVIQGTLLTPARHAGLGCASHA